MKTRRCAIYMRETDEEASNYRQFAELEQQVAKDGYKVIKVYEDKGIGPRAERPGRLQLLRDAKAGKFDIVLVWSLDKLFTSVRQLFEQAEEWQNLGIGIVSLKDNIDNVGARGKFMAHIFWVFANFQRAVIMERVRNANNGSKKRGCWGTRRTIDRETVYTLRAEGLSYWAISKKMNCSPGHVCRILQEKNGVIYKGKAKRPC